MDPPGLDVGGELRLVDPLVVDRRPPARRRWNRQVRDHGGQAKLDPRGLGLAQPGHDRREGAPPLIPDQAPELVVGQDPRAESPAQLRIEQSHHGLCGHLGIQQRRGLAQGRQRSVVRDAERLLDVRDASALVELAAVGPLALRDAGSRPNLGIRIFVDGSSQSCVLGLLAQSTLARTRALGSTQVLLGRERVPQPEQYLSTPRQQGADVGPARDGAGIEVERPRVVDRRQAVVPLGSLEVGEGDERGHSSSAPEILQQDRVRLVGASGVDEGSRPGPRRLAQRATASCFGQLDRLVVAPLRHQPGDAGVTTRLQPTHHEQAHHDGPAARPSTRTRRPGAHPPPPAAQPSASSPPTSATSASRSFCSSRRNASRSRSARHKKGIPGSGSPK